MIKYESYTKVTLRVEENRSDLLFFFPLCFFFQMTVVVGVGVTLSCFKVKVPFIVAIKHSRCGRKKALERQGRARHRDTETKRELMV